MLKRHLSPRAIPRYWLAAGLLLAVPAAAQAPELEMLGTLAKGSWRLRILDDGGQQKVCVHNGRELIQLRHPQTGCNRFIVEDTPEQVVVQYTCRGSGYGRTSIRRESGELVQIRSQGILDDAPFSFRAEGRRTGPC